MKTGFLRQHASIFELILRFADSIIMFFAGVAAYYLRFNNLDLSFEYRYALFTGGIAVFVIFHEFRIYATWRGKSIFDEIQKIIPAITLAFLVLAALSVLFQVSEHFSRIWVGIWIALTFFTIASSRVVLRVLLFEARRRGMNSRSMIIIGTCDEIARAENIVFNASYLGLRVVGHVSVDANNHHNLKTKNLGMSTDIEKLIVDHDVDQVWIATTFEQSALANIILLNLKNSPVSIKWLPHFYDFQLLNHSISQVDGYPILNLSDTPIQGVARISKWLEDKILASIILLMISPVLLAIALAVKWTSRGPILFKQERHGERGQIIKVYKFRSMYMHDEGKSVTQAKKGDSRITPLGSFLRRTSLDELPQFFNVLQGRMSIVGPRPHALVHNKQYRKSIDSYMRRHGVKPGITGWAQINGLRGETDTLDKMERRVEADMYYINNWSLWLDIKIIFLTIFRGFTGGNAY